jgi:hypothetical protein
VDNGVTAIRFATICTPLYRPQLDRLLFSIAKTHPDASVEVFTNDPSEFPGIAGPSVRLVEMPEIDRLGVKRAKFRMYQIAMEGGPFVYLDADIVVLDDLTELTASADLTACPDDLTGCPFVVDRMYPWPRHPDLKNVVYVNSGVLGFGANLQQPIDEAAEAVGDDDFWFRHIHPGGLFDNHVLCALINMQGWPLRLVSEVAFNWRGFRNSDGSIAAIPVADGLVHADSGERLRLIHFAGIRDIDDYLIDVPLDVARAINVASVAPMSPAQAVAAVIAGVDTSLLMDHPDPHRLIAADVLSRAFADSWSDIRRERLQTTYVADPDVMTSVSLALPPTSTRWNDLACGGAYLEPAEYVFLRDVAQSLPMGSIVETGAGETTLLFSKHQRTVSIEAFEGPWHTRACESNAEVHLVSFEPEAGFDDEALIRIISAAGDISLLFIDSPSGAPNRRLALRQILAKSKPMHVAIHDSRRDLHTLLTELAGRGYLVTQVLDSFRGLFLLSRSDVPRLMLPTRASAPLPDGVAAEIRILETRLRMASEARASVTVVIRNRSNLKWPCSGEWPVHISYHVLQSNSVVRFDGARTELACPLDPSDVVECLVSIDATGLSPGEYAIQFALVQEGVRWFGESDATLHLTVDLPPADPIHARRNRRSPADQQETGSEPRSDRRLRSVQTAPGPDGVL